MSRTCKVISWNVRSILNEHKLQNVLQILDDNDIQVACLTETWFDGQNGTFTANIKSAGYEIKHATRDNKGGGGAAILYKRTMNIKPGEANSNKYASFEFSYCVINNSQVKLLLICIYRRQEVPCKTFCEEFEKFMDAVFHKGDITIVVGDFNVWIDVEDDIDTRRLLTLMNAYGLNQLIKVPTHVAGHTLDHVYVNEQQISFTCNVLEKQGELSDHLPTIFEVPYGESERKTETISFRKLKDINIDNLRNELKGVYENLQFTETTNFETDYNLYRVASEKVIDKHAPVVTKKVSQNVAVPWADTEFKEARRERRRLEKKWRKNKTDENRQLYVEQRERCAEMSIVKQKAYYSKIVNETGNDQKSLFNVVNNLLDKNEVRILPEHIDPVTLANEFNEFYIKKVNDLRDTIPASNEELDIESDLFTGTQLFEFEPATEEEIKEIIKESGIKTSPEDPVPAKIMQAVIDEAIPTLTKLVNKSMAEGSMEGVKLSVIDPLLKKADLDAETRKHYRPVNNLVFFSKLTERIVMKRLNAHMATNGLFCDNEFAYKKYHSTETMMLGNVNDILLGFDKNLCTVMLFLDLSAAFDTIDIDRLLGVLSDEIGIAGNALKWFSSFLKGRTQKVRIKNAFSSCLEVMFGTVQGSVLGPKLFNIYVRSQPKVFQKCHFKNTSFADDANGTKTFSVQFQYNVLKNDLPDCLKEITKWMNINFLKINGDKTEILLLFPQSIANRVIINGTMFGNQCIRFSKEVKNVGVTLDQNLTLDKHINKIVSHSHKLLKDIGRIRNVLSNKHTEMLVHAVISSRLDYCNSLFFNLKQQNIFKLQKVQNAAARLVARIRKRDSVRCKMKELHWLRVESRVIFKLILIVYKCINERCSKNLKITYKRYNCRPNDYLLLETTAVKTKYGKRTFDFAAPRLWNALPLDVRIEGDIEKFKKRVKTILFKDTEGFLKHAFKYNS